MVTYSERLVFLSLCPFSNPSLRAYCFPLHADGAQFGERHLILALIFNRARLSRLLPSNQLQHICT